MKLSCWEKSRREREQSEEGRKVRGEQEREGERKSKAMPGRDRVANGSLVVSAMRKDPEKKQQSFRWPICADLARNHKSKGTIFYSSKDRFLHALGSDCWHDFQMQDFNNANLSNVCFPSLLDLWAVLCVGTRRIYFSFGCLILVSSTGLSWPSQMLIFLLQKL